MKHLLPILLLCACAWGADTTRVVLIIGQSNAVGQGDTTQQPAQANSRMFKWTAAGTRVALREPTAIRDAGLGSMATSFCNYVTSALTADTITVVNSAYGGTPVIKNVTNVYWLYTDTSGILSHSIKDFRAAWNAASEPKKAYVLWYQGESDAQLNRSTVPYRDSLLVFLRRAKDSVTAVAGSVKIIDIPLGYGAPAGYAGKDRWRKILLAKYMVADSLRDTSWYSMSGPIYDAEFKTTDTVHLSMRGLDTVGVRAGAAFLRAIGRLNYSRGPVLSSAKLRTNAKELDFTFTSDSNSIDSVSSISTLRIFGKTAADSNNYDYGEYSLSLSLFNTPIAIDSTKRTGPKAYRIFMNSEVNYPYINNASISNQNLTSILYSSTTKKFPFEPVFDLQPSTTPTPYPVMDTSLVWMANARALKNGINPASFNTGRFPTYSRSGTWYFDMVSLPSGKGYVADSGYILIDSARTRWLLSNNTGLSVTNSSVFTVAAWVKVQANTVAQTIWSVGMGTTVYFSLDIASDEKPQIQWRKGGATTALSQKPTNNAFIMGNGYHYLELIKDADTMRIRCDGKDIGPTITGSRTYTYGDTTFTSGDKIGNRWDNVVGLLSPVYAVARYSRKLTNSESMQNFWAGRKLFAGTRYSDTTGGVSDSLLTTPTLSFVTPSNAKPGDTITVSGSYFPRNTQIRLGTYQATVIDDQDYEQKIIVPNGTGTVDVYAVAPDSVRDTLTNAFTFDNQFSVSTLVPDSGFVSGGDTITIRGQSFKETRGTGFVKFDGTEVSTYVSWSDTLLRVITPAKPKGTRTCLVQNSDSVNGSKNFKYYYTVSNFTLTPAVGSPAGNQVVGVKTSGKWIIPTNLTATIDGRSCTSVTRVNYDSLYFTTPIGLVGNRDVIITNDSASTKTMSNSFLYEVPVTGTYPIKKNVRKGIQYGQNGSDSTGTLEVRPPIFGGRR